MTFHYEIADPEEFKNLEQTIEKALSLCLEKLEIEHLN